MKLMQLLTACILVIINSASLGLPADDRPQVTEPSKPLRVTASNPEFEIVVKSNPTTGYVWLLSQFDANVILPESHQRVPAKINSARTIVGVGGFERWRFKVKPEAFAVPSITTINLVHGRVWDLKKATVVQYMVIVEGR